MRQSGSDQTLTGIHGAVGGDLEECVVCGQDTGRGSRVSVIPGVWLLDNSRTDKTYDNPGAGYGDGCED